VRTRCVIVSCYTGREPRRPWRSQEMQREHCRAWELTRLHYGQRGRWAGMSRCLQGLVQGGILLWSEEDLLL